MILDTNAVSALFLGDPGLERVLAGTFRPSLPVIVLGEYQFGLQRSRARTHLQSLLDQLERHCVVLDVTAATARQYAVVRDWLRQQGTPLPENDVWIAALAIEHRQPLVSRDAHFDVVNGLQRIGW